MFPILQEHLNMCSNIKIISIKHKGIRNILGLGFLANEDEVGKVNIETNTGTSTDHSIMTFINDISKLSDGTYHWNGTNWVKQ